MVELMGLYNWFLQLKTFFNIVCLVKTFNNSLKHMPFSSGFCVGNTHSMNSYS